MADTRETDLEWRLMLRLPQSWGNEVTRMAREQAVPLAVMVRILLKEAMDARTQGAHHGHD